VEAPVRFAGASRFFFIFILDILIYFCIVVVKMEQVLEDYINGNLSDAKRRVRKKKYTFRQVYMAARNMFSEKKAMAVTFYLTEPSQETFQAACDSE